MELEAGQVVVPTVSGEGWLTAVLDLQQQELTGELDAYWIARSGTYLFRVEGTKDCRVGLTYSLAEQSAMPAGGPGDAEMPPHGMRIWRTSLKKGQAWRLDLGFPKHVPSRHSGGK